MIILWVSLSPSVYLSAEEVSVCRLSSWRLQVRGHDPESSWASWVNALILTEHSNPELWRRKLKSVKAPLLTSDCVFVHSCVLFIHWSVEVSRDGAVTPKINLLTKIPDRGEMFVWLLQTETPTLHAGPDRHTGCLLLSRFGFRCQTQSSKEKRNTCY